MSQFGGFLEPAPYAVGNLVEHPKFGLGKVVALVGQTARVRFRDDVEESRRIDLRSGKLQPSSVTSDPQLDRLLALPEVRSSKPMRGKSKPSGGSLEDAIERFLLEFPEGFRDPAYIGNGKIRGPGAGHRQYKEDAALQWTSMLGEGRGEDLLARGEIEELSTRARQVVAKTDLLGQFPPRALKRGLSETEPARRFFECLLPFVREPVTPRSFQSLADAVYELPVDDGQTPVATWPVLTIMPFLARPDRFIFLKPRDTQACAARMGFDLQYDPNLRWLTYERLMELSDRLLERLGRDGARDYIDVQSFIYAIARY